MVCRSVVWCWCTGSWSVVQATARLSPHLKGKAELGKQLQYKMTANSSVFDIDMQCTFIL